MEQLTKEQRYGECGNMGKCKKGCFVTSKKHKTIIFTILKMSLMKHGWLLRI